MGRQDERFSTASQREEGQEDRATLPAHLPETVGPRQVKLYLPPGEQAKAAGVCPHQCTCPSGPWAGEGNAVDYQE